MTRRSSASRRPVRVTLPSVRARTPEACRSVVAALVASADLDPACIGVAVIGPAWWAMGPWGRA